MTISPALQRARQIITAWRNTPPPLAGKIDTDAVLANLIAQELETTSTKTETVEASADDQRAATETELSIARTMIDRLLAKKSALEAKLTALADRLESQTFGGGLATEQDLYGIANEIRAIVLKT